MHEEAEKVKVKRDESVEKIDHLLENIEDLKFHEFEDLLYCYNMLLTAYGSIGNTSAVQYYLKEIDPDEIIMPEELKEIQIDLEMNIAELETHINDWYD